MNLKKIGILILCLGMLLPLGCSPDDRPDVGTVYLEPDTEHVTVEGNTNAVQPMKQPDASCTPIPLAAETTPYAPRDPREDDVSKERFPNYDTGVDADYSYQSDELRIAIKKYTDEDEGQIYYVADIWMRSLNCFRMGFAHGKYNTGHEDPASFAQRDNVIFGVSGSFNKGLVIHNGEKTKGVEDNLIGFTSGIMVVYRDGTVKMIDRNQKEKFNYSKENKSRGGVLHALQFGPILLNDGKIPAGLKKNERHPRIIFGYYEPGHYAAVAVAGRRRHCRTQHRRHAGVCGIRRKRQRGVAHNGASEQVPRRIKMEERPKKSTGWIIGVAVMAVLTTLALAADILIFGMLWF